MIAEPKLVRLLYKDLRLCAATAALQELTSRNIVKLYGKEPRIMFSERDVTRRQSGLGNIVVKARRSCLHRGSYMSASCDKGLASCLRLEEEVVVGLRNLARVDSVDRGRKL